MSYPGFQYDELSRSLLAPADYQNPTPQARYHLAVVGAGPAGLIAAIGAAGLGAKVALIEADLMGGDCLNIGCVPSKALLEYTHKNPTGSFADAFAHLRAVRAGIAPHDSVARYSELGVDVFLGRAAFNAQGQLEVKNTVIDARRICLATGARAGIPPIPGLADIDYLTNDTLFDLTKQPASIGILGAGAIGCEMATVFARLGTEVHLFEMADRVLPLEDVRAAEILEPRLAALGVKVHTNAQVQQIDQGEGTVTIQADAAYMVERVLVAAGRQPNTDALGLENTAVQTDAQGFIRTDDKLRTDAKGVFAAGDCASRTQFTHYADACARVVVQNALFAPTASVAGLAVPRCTYTDPEVASIGSVGEQPVDEYTFALGDLDRSRTQGDADGVAIVQTAKGTDKIVAATIVGIGAGELIAVLCVLISNNLGLSAIGKALLPYPTRSEFLKRLADAYNRTRMTPLVERIFKLWLNRTA